MDDKLKDGPSLSSRAASLFLFCLWPNQSVVTDVFVLLMSFSVEAVIAVVRGS